MPPRLMTRLLALLAVLVAALPALADEFLDRANALYATIAPDKRSDLILLPAVAKMDPPPASVDSIGKAALLPAGSSGWSVAEEWALAAPQRAVLEALDRITKDETATIGMAFGQPYGADAMGPEPHGPDLVDAGLYTELGEPPMLAGARHLYLPALDRVGALVYVEATRLAAADKPDEAIGVLIDWLFFARQMADRQLFAEARWGLRTMTGTLERIRDVAYTDMRSGKRQLTADHILAIQERLAETRTYVRLDRLQFPAANRIAVEQVIAHVFQQRGGPNAAFGQMMAQLASTQRPLRLFAEAARWDQIASNHADSLDTARQLATVYSDMEARWAWDPWDPRLAVQTDYEKMDKARFAVIATVLPDMTVLLNDRQVLRTQLVGTRTALAVVAFAYGARNFPPTLASLRPHFVKNLEADPFNPDRANRKEPPLEYFVPIRDQTFGPREEPGPYEINVVTTAGQNFQVRIGQDQFVLYSVGPNGIKDYARNVSGEPARGQVGDLLLWPPVTSLIRQRLIETGALR